MRSFLAGLNPALAVVYLVGALAGRRPRFSPRKLKIFKVNFRIFSTYNTLGLLNKPQRKRGNKAID